MFPFNKKCLIALTIDLFFCVDYLIMIHTVSLESTKEA